MRLNFQINLLIIKQSQKDFNKPKNGNNDQLNKIDQ